MHKGRVGLTPALSKCLAALTTQLETVLINYLTEMCTEILVSPVLTLV